jgi:hypothetical protein
MKLEEQTRASGPRTVKPVALMCSMLESKRKMNEYRLQYEIQSLWTEKRKWQRRAYIVLGFLGVSTVFLLLSLSDAASTQRCRAAINRITCEPGVLVQVLSRDSLLCRDPDERVRIVSTSPWQRELNSRVPSLRSPRYHRSTS